MEQADVGIDSLDHFAVELQDQAQHTVCRRCCGPKLIVKLRSAASAMRISFASLEPETPGTFICSANAPIDGAFVPDGQERLPAALIGFFAGGHLERRRHHQPR
jgi:hypothetical protein